MGLTLFDSDNSRSMACVKTMSSLSYFVAILTTLYFHTACCNARPAGVNLAPQERFLHAHSLEPEVHPGRFLLPNGWRWRTFDILGGPFREHPSRYPWRSAVDGPLYRSFRENDGPAPDRLHPGFTPGTVAVPVRSAGMRRPAGAGRRGTRRAASDGWRRAVSGDNTASRQEGRPGRWPRRLHDGDVGLAGSGGTSRRCPDAPAGVRARAQSKRSDAGNPFGTVRPLWPRLPVQGARASAAKVRIRVPVRQTRPSDCTNITASDRRPSR